MSSNRRNYEREEDNLSFRSQRIEKEGLPRTTYRDTRERERERDRGGRQRNGGRYQRERSPERRNDRYARTRDFHRFHDRDWDRGSERRLERERERVPDSDRMFRRERYDRYDRYDRGIDRRREDVGERFRGSDRRGEREREQELEREKEKEKRHEERRDSEISGLGEDSKQAETIPKRNGQPEEKQTNGSFERAVTTSSRNGNGKDQDQEQEQNINPKEKKEEEEVIVQEELDPMGDMQSMMGFSGFGTTTGKKHGDVGDVFKQKKARYRQYMNRPGGFNRPLERD